MTDNLKLCACYISRCTAAMLLTETKNSKQKIVKNFTKTLPMWTNSLSSWSVIFSWFINESNVTREAKTRACVSTILRSAKSIIVSVKACLSSTVRDCEENESIGFDRQFTYGQFFKIPWYQNSNCLKWPEHEWPPFATLTRHVRHLRFR